MKEQETLVDKLGRWINMAGTAVMMNLLFVICCLPVVTIGQAWCGLMSAIRYNIRGDKWFTGFKQGFKTRFVRGTVCWVAMLIVILHMLLDMLYNMEGEYMVPFIASCLMFALMAMVLCAFMALNVYIPTSIGNWLRNAAGMVFKAPLQLLVSAALAWLPVVLFLFFPEIAYYVAMIFLVVYFPLAALGTTILLKETLVDYLIDARAEGTLLAEEGKRAEEDEEEDEEE